MRWTPAISTKYMYSEAAKPQIGALNFIE
jgi:hypothetical protein